MNKETEVTLYFFTGSYPYGGVETFIENEILFLSDTYKKIIIVPSQLSKTKRETPENVHIDNSFSKLFMNNGRKFKSLFSLNFVNALLYHSKYLLSLMALRRINSFVSDSEIVYKWLIKNKIEDNSIIYTYWLNGKTFGAIKYKAKCSPKIKIVSRAHRYDLYDYWWKPEFWPYRQKTLDLIDHLFVISQDGISFLKSKYKLEENVSLSRLGIIDRGFLGKTSSDDTIRIVSVANLNEVKRIPYLLELLNKFCVEHRSVCIEWTHFGDGPEMSILKNKAKRLKLSNLIISLKGRVPNEKIYNYYQNIEVDLFVNISESEGVPVSIMEAQSFGKFVIATDVGGTKELINHSSGILLPKNLTYEDFKLAICSFIKMNHVIDSNKIRNFCLENYDASKNYKNFMESLLNLSSE